MDKPTLAQFWEQLNKHDWYHMYSDDGRVDRMGAADYDRLAKLAEESGPEYVQLMKEFGDHMFTGKPWNTEQKPKPKKPVD
jgi:hypothetical protein